ncbi:hypothetical protein [Rhizocola hellebori]|nr:hypothetical protein [Rhizocola hellebori]
MALERIDEEMDKVTDHGVGLVAVAKAVKSLNLTLAHHTAWAEERFEAIDHRFEAVDQRFAAIDRRFEAVDRRFDSMDAKLEIMDRKMDTGFGLIINEINRLSARVEQVVAFAIPDELKVDEINE